MHRIPQWAKLTVYAAILQTACSDSDPLDSHGAVTAGPTTNPTGASGNGSSANTGTQPTDGDGTTSDSGGDSETGTSEPTGGTSETGGPEPTREVCDRYLDCIAATTPEALPAAQEGFGPDGTCWDGPPQSIEQCIQACQTGWGELREVYPDEVACFECEGDGECAAEERCVAGECRVKGCGDEIVDADEVCDGPYCGADCSSRGVACNPLTNAGCEPGQLCYGGSFCDNLPDPLGQDGSTCSPEGFVIDCDAGLYCYPAPFGSDCPGDGCCTLYCNLQEPDDCPNGRVCTAVLAEDDPQGNFLGVCAFD